MSVLEIGRHRFLCGDLTDGAVERLMGDERADVVYSDPPWGPGKLQAFATEAEPGSAPRTEWREFLATFAGVVAKHIRSGAPVFVEMGLRWTADLDDAMTAAGLPFVNRWRILYGPKSKPLPATLALYSADAHVILPDPPHGEPVTRDVLSHVVRPGSIVLDPCTGLGMTSRWTHKLGGDFRGTELVASRMARATAWLEKNQ